MALCECGCGEEVNPGRIFINGHQRRGERYWKMQLPPQLCECGCGEEVSLGKRFIVGHNACKTPWERKTGPQLCECECGCGQETTIYRGTPRRFITGHNRRGVAVSVEHRANLSKSLEGHIQSDSHKDAISKAKTGIPHTSSAQLTADEAMRGVPQTPEHIAAVKKGVEESGIYDMMRGGNDIVWHHVAYDFNAPNVLRVKMTRKAHGALHKPKGISVSKRGYSLID